MSSKRKLPPVKPESDFYKEVLGVAIAHLPRCTTHRDKKRYNRKTNRKELSDACR
jgi:hypothetical protein